MNGITIPFSFGLFLLCQTSAAIWWASGVDSEVVRLVQQDVQYQDHKTEYIQRLSVIETKVESNHSILLKLEEKQDKEKKMKKLLGLMGAFLLTTPAFAGVSGGVDLASEYLWRGASQSTGDDPVVQFNLEADYNGFYGGTWGSQVDFGDGKFVEYDFYGGYATSYKDISIDVGIIQYNYNKFIDESVEEWYAILGYKYVSVSYYKDMDNGESDYTEVSIDLPISNKLDVSARYGKLADGEDYQQLSLIHI